MKKFMPIEHFQLMNETPFPIVQPSYKGFQLIAQYLNKKYATEIIREDVDFYWMEQVENNIHLFRKYVDEARKIPGDHRFAWVTGTSHAVTLVYIRENGEEALFYTDSNRSPDAIIPDFAQKLSDLVGLPVYTTLGNRQADLRSCYNDALVFSRDITGRDLKTGKYLIPDFLTVLRKRAKKLGDSSFEAKVPDELLKTSQISSFLNSQKEPDERVIHKTETLSQFRQRYSKEAMIKGQNKLVPNYLVEKGFKYRDVMQIQFYLNQMPYLTDSQRESFVKEAKKLLKSDAGNNGLYDFAIQQATALGYPPENPFVRAALSKCDSSTVMHEVVSNQKLSDLQAFYELIPKPFHFKVVTSTEPAGNTVLHWAASHPEKFKYLLNSLTETEMEAERSDALRIPGENNNTALHWVAANPELLEFALNSINVTRRLQAVTTPGQNGNTVLHWLEKEPQSLKIALNLLPSHQRLEAITVPGENGASLLHWIQSKPASLEAVLGCLSTNERAALNIVLKNELPSCPELIQQIQDTMSKEPPIAPIQSQVTETTASPTPTAKPIPVDAPLNATTTREQSTVKPLETPPLVASPTNVPKSYKNIYNKQPDPVAATKALLNDYTKGNSYLKRLMHFHPRRNHAKEVNNIVQDKQLDSVEKILSALERIKGIDPKGSLARRIEFIKSQNPLNNQTLTDAAEERSNKI